MMITRISNSNPTAEIKCLAATPTKVAITTGTMVNPSRMPQTTRIIITMVVMVATTTINNTDSRELQQVNAEIQKFKNHQKSYNYKYHGVLGFWGFGVLGPAFVVLTPSSFPVFLKNIGTSNPCHTQRIDFLALNFPPAFQHIN